MLENKEFPSYEEFKEIYPHLNSLEDFINQWIYDSTFKRWDELKKEWEY